MWPAHTESAGPRAAAFLIPALQCGLMSLGGWPVNDHLSRLEIDILHIVAGGPWVARVDLGSLLEPLGQTARVWTLATRTLALSLLAHDPAALVAGATPDAPISSDARGAAVARTGRAAACWPTGRTRAARPAISAIGRSRVGTCGRGRVRGSGHSRAVEFRTGCRRRITEHRIGPLNRPLKMPGAAVALPGPELPVPTPVPMPEKVDPKFASFDEPPGALPMPGLKEGTSKDCGSEGWLGSTGLGSTSPMFRPCSDPVGSPNGPLPVYVTGLPNESTRLDGAADSADRPRFPAATDCGADNRANPRQAECRGCQPCAGQVSIEARDVGVRGRVGSFGPSIGAVPIAHVEAARRGRLTRLGPADAGSGRAGLWGLRPGQCGHRGLDAAQIESPEGVLLGARSA